MKIFWVIPLTVDRVLQFTSKNELARSVNYLGHEMTTIVAYNEEKVTLDGFSDVEYVKTKPTSFLSIAVFHLKMLLAVLQTDADVILFGYPAAHLIPMGRIGWLGRKRPRFVLDIRTIPVDVQNDIRGKLEVLRFKTGLLLSDLFCDAVTFITDALGKSVRPYLRRIYWRRGYWSSGVQLDHFKRYGDDVRLPLNILDKKVLFYHGVLSPNRGLQNALRAVKILKERIPEIFFLIVGDGSGRKELETLAECLRITDNVMFTGKIPYSDIPRYIRSADCAIIPFPDILWWQVSSPIKLMEYLAAGIPIVATDIEAHGILKRIIKDAVLAPDNKPRTLADSVQRTLKMNNTYSEVDVLEKKISWESQAEALIVFLEKQIKGLAS